jgi:hypothetical protein
MGRISLRITKFGYVEDYLHFKHSDQETQKLALRKTVHPFNAIKTLRRKAYGQTSLKTV